jgi:hypothetical protein
MTGHPKNIASAQAATEGDEQIEGRSVFSVETTQAGIVVSTVFLANDGQLINLPAVFPNLEYAMDQINKLENW